METTKIKLLRVLEILRETDEDQRNNKIYQIKVLRDRIFLLNM